MDTDGWIAPSLPSPSQSVVGLPRDVTPPSPTPAKLAPRGWWRGLPILRLIQTILYPFPTRLQRHIYPIQIYNGLIRILDPSDTGPFCPLPIRMTQLTSSSPAWLAIEDELDRIGQRHRVYLLVRGTIFFFASALLATLASALLCNTTGPGLLSRLISLTWALWIIATAIYWIGRPLIFRPRPLAVARLIEQRITGLHNGLTNSIQFAHRDDLQSSPWLNPIYDEILASTQSQNLNQAVSLRLLKKTSLRLLGFVLIPSLLTSALFAGPVGHGLQQMFAPLTFIPHTGQMTIVSLSPGDITLVRGQSLDLMLLATGPDQPQARIIIDDHRPDLLITGSLDQSQLRYTARIDNLDQSTRYRVEVGTTQSDWHNITIVPRITLQTLTLNITPPAYTRQSSIQLNLTPKDLAAASLAYPEGSRLDLSATIDVAMPSGLIDLGGAAPLPMQSDSAGKSFSTSFTLSRDTSLRFLFATASGQIAAQLPEVPLSIRCQTDAPPSIDMQFPTADAPIPLKGEIHIKARLKDDHGLNLWMLRYAQDPAPVSSSASSTAGSTASASSRSPASPSIAASSAATDIKWTTPQQAQLSSQPLDQPLDLTLAVPDAVRVHGRTIRVQLLATDNRQLPPIRPDDLGPKTTASPVFTLKFQDAELIARQKKAELDELTRILRQLLDQQKTLLDQSVALNISDASPADASLLSALRTGQQTLGKSLQSTADTFPFSPIDRLVQKALLTLAAGPAREANDLSAGIAAEPLPNQQARLNLQLQSRQKVIISTLESLISMIKSATDAIDNPSLAGNDLNNPADALKKLQQALAEYMKEQQRIIDQSASLAKKPVDQWDDNDRKLAAELTMAQEKLDAFMQDLISDYSKLGEQDLANSSLLKDLMSIYSETTMAADALNKQNVEMAVSLEEAGLELAEELNSNIEKWLTDEPDRQKWTMEDPLTKTDTPMAELPTELEDMIGELMEQQEDLFDEMEDTAANWTDSIDKGQGWDAVDGPIADMSAKGVTGNTLPNNNEMNGRAGEGRQGKSEGEFVGDSATGKGGRNTPTRLDPTAFQKGQVNDTSTDPQGGATGGGKLSGQGGEGLEGPVPPEAQAEMKRLAQQQAALRNKAEHIDPKGQLSEYDNHRLQEAIAMMRRVESDLQANRYNQAFHRKDVLLNELDTSRTLASAQSQVQRDASTGSTANADKDINSAAAAPIPDAWSGPLQEYYKNLSQQP